MTIKQTTSTKPRKKIKKIDRHAEMLARTKDQVSHLHVVIDDVLRAKLEAHARKVEGLTPKHKNYDRPNLSAAVRNLLRQSLGLPIVESA